MHHSTCCIHVAPFKPSEPIPQDHKGQTHSCINVLKLAPPFSAEEHQKYLSTTGTVQLPPSWPSHLELILFAFISGDSTASHIVENILSHTWTASAVLEAYIAQVVQAHQVTNCFTEGMCTLPVIASY